MGISIKILGTGCTRCEKLAEIVTEVAGREAPGATVEKVGNIEEILKYKVMSTPALVINEKVVSSGRVPSGEEIHSYIENAKKVH